MLIVLGGTLCARIKTIAPYASSGIRKHETSTSRAAQAHRAWRLAGARNNARIYGYWRWAGGDIIRVRAACHVSRVRVRARVCRSKDADLHRSGGVLHASVCLCITSARLTANRPPYSSPVSEGAFPLYIYIYTHAHPRRTPRRSFFRDRTAAAGRRRTCTT